MTGIDYTLLREIKQAIDAGAISAFYSDFNEPSVSELEERMKALDEIDVYTVVRTLVKYRRKLFVDILEYMNKQEGEKHNAKNDSNI